MSKAFTKPLFLFYKSLVRRLKATILFLHTTTPPPPPSTTTSAATAKPHKRATRCASLDALLTDRAISMCKLEGGLLMSSSTFPYFMLVALEGGGLLRGLLLLLLYPLLPLLSHEVALKVMVMVCFLGIKKNTFSQGRAVMPKLFLADVGYEVYEVVVKSSKRCVCFSDMPRIMVEGFLKEYLDVDAVVAPELKEMKGYYIGLMEEESKVLHRGLGLEELIGVKNIINGGVVGIGGLGNSFHQLFQKYCKEVYIPTESERRRWRRLPSGRLPYPLVFHDGRIAFRPTPAATLAMFTWLPLGVSLAVLRAAVFLVLPYALSIPLLALLGMHSRCVDLPPTPLAGSGHLFACNHRSLLDPLYVSGAVGRTDLSAVTYSISRLSEVLAPIRTVRLTRDRAADRVAMEKQLAGGGLVVCPEGTTCREPFLLRFSPLFAELGHAVSPVALHTEVGMFHGTTARGWKFLDPIFLLINPTPCYILQFLDPVECAAGNVQAARRVANNVQRRIAAALGYRCTSLTRRDKYLMLAGNEGAIDAKQ